MRVFVNYLVLYLTELHITLLQDVYKVFIYAVTNTCNKNESSQKHTPFILPRNLSIQCETRNRIHFSKAYLQLNGF